MSMRWRVGWAGALTAAVTTGLALAVAAGAELQAGPGDAGAAAGAAPNPRDVPLHATAAAAHPHASPTEAEVLATTYYAFHSDPWVNLHHFLYQWSRADRGIGTGRAAVPVPERDGVQPTGDAADAWDAALAFYREHVAERGHFDDAMLELKAGLVGLSGDLSATPPDDIPGVSAQLAAAMPVYRERWWPEHDRANRAWIAYVADDVRRHEARWVETVTRLFGGRWIEGRLRVDASAYANWQGGYTSNFPPHTVIWSTDETNSTGLYGLEMVFHEPGHMTSLGAPLRSAVREIFAEVGVQEPENLRHAMLFGAAGELTRLIAEERGLPPHVPYVIAEGLSGFVGWSEPWLLVERHWLPLLGGEGDPRDAIRRMAEALRSPD